jgi:hypothetical protein
MQEFNKKANDTYSYLKVQRNVSNKSKRSRDVGRLRRKSHADRAGGTRIFIVDSYKKCNVFVFGLYCGARQM